MQEKLKKKYGLTDSELKEGIDIVSKNLGKICDVNVLLAVTDLLVNGDVVVKCKECKFFSDLRCENPDANVIDGKLYLNHYCSFGERR